MAAESKAKAANSWMGWLRGASATPQSQLVPGAQDAAPELTPEEYSRLVELVTEQEQGLRCGAAFPSWRSSSSAPTRSSSYQLMLHLASTCSSCCCCNFLPCFVAQGWLGDALHDADSCWCAGGLCIGCAGGSR